MSKYILVTKFYNERQLLPRIVNNVAKQTLRPVTFIFIDDGSIDGSSDIARAEALKHSLPYEIIAMPQKSRGNLDTLGRAWNTAQPLIRKLAESAQYVAMTDVDTIFPLDYFENMIDFMDTHPDIGVVAGQVTEEPKRSFPMFTGKVVRADIIKRIDHYWDISVDSFINIKALRFGYEVVIRDEIDVTSPPTHLLTAKGRFRAGRLAYYGGTGVSYAIAKGLLKRDAQFLRGYWFERRRNVWRCQDEDILEYYRSEFRRKLLSLVNRVTHRLLA